MFVKSFNFLQKLAESYYKKFRCLCLYLIVSPSALAPSIIFRLSVCLLLVTERQTDGNWTNTICSMYMNCIKQQQTDRNYLKTSLIKSMRKIKKGTKEYNLLLDSQLDWEEYSWHRQVKIVWIILLRNKNLHISLFDLI